MKKKDRESMSCLYFFICDYMFVHAYVNDQEYAMCFIQFLFTPDKWKRQYSRNAKRTASEREREKKKIWTHIRTNKQQSKIVITVNVYKKIYCTICVYLWICFNWKCYRHFGSASMWINDRTNETSKWTSKQANNWKIIIYNYRYQNVHLFGSVAIISLSLVIIVFFSFFRW